MAEADRLRWDERYARAGVAVGGVRPAPPDRIEDLDEALPRSGRALDVACGLGAQALWAAARGLATDAVDVSPVAVRHLREAARRLGLDDRVRVRRADLDDGLPDGITGPYDLVVCQRFLDRDLLATMPGLLVPGGWAVVTVLAAAAPEASSAHRAAPGELERRLTAPGLIRHRSVEADGQATVVVQRDRPARLTS